MERRWSWRTEEDRGIEKKRDGGKERVAEEIKTRFKGDGVARARSPEDQRKKKLRGGFVYFLKLIQCGSPAFRFKRGERENRFRC